MSEKNATIIEWAGCAIVVSAMLISRFLISIPETAMIIIASISLVMMSAGMISLKLIQVRKEKALMKK